MAINDYVNSTATPPPADNCLCELWPRPIPVGGRLPAVDEDGSAFVMFYLYDPDGEGECWRFGHYHITADRGLPGNWFTDDVEFNTRNCPLTPTHWLPLPPKPE